MTSCLIKSAIQNTPTSVTNTPSPTLTPFASSTPIVTAVPNPSGAGAVTPTFEVTFDQHLEDLPAGEYLVVQMAADGDPDSPVEKFRFVGLDGGLSGLLFTVRGERHGRLLSRGPQLVLAPMGDQNSEILFLDLRTRQAGQFSMGCRAYLSLPTVDRHHFGFTCDDYGQIWSVVSTEDWRMTSYFFRTTYGLTWLGWITPELALIENSDNNTAFFGEHPPKTFCTLQMPERLKDCLDDAPAWWGMPSAVSPDEEWVVRGYADPANPNTYVWALLPTVCLEQPAQTKCAPQIIPVPAGVLMYSDPYVSWSGSGEKVVFVNAERPGGSKTTIWSYDLESGQSTWLSTYNGNHVLVGPWTADGEDFLLIDESVPGDQRIWLVSSITGGMHTVAAGQTGITDVLGLFQVP